MTWKWALQRIPVSPSLWGMGQEDYTFQTHMGCDLAHGLFYFILFVYFFLNHLEFVINRDQTQPIYILRPLFCNILKNNLYSGVLFFNIVTNSWINFFKKSKYLYLWRNVNIYKYVTYTLSFKVLLLYKSGSRSCG